MSRMKAFQMNTVNAATIVPVCKLERMKLMTVAANMAAITQLEKPFHL